MIPLPKAVPTTTTTKTKPDDYSAYERNFLEATNRARKGQGAPALRINAVLAKLARTHAARMARAGDVATRIGGVSLSDEVENSGYEYLAVGPVVSAYPVLDFDYVLRDLQTDAGIRKMLLDGGYVDIGIGIAKGDGKVFYLVQLLGSPDTGE